MPNKKGKGQPLYGVTLNIHPAGPPTKRIVIHRFNCSDYQKAKQGPSPGIYTFHKDAMTLRKALKWAVTQSLEWHAEIFLCKHCIRKGQQIPV